MKIGDIVTVIFDDRKEQGLIVHMDYKEKGILLEFNNGEYVLLPTEAIQGIDTNEH